MKEHYLTVAGEKKLRAELEELSGPARDALAKRLRSAIQMGDLSENADYIKAKEDQGFLEGRIQELTYILNHATLIEENGDGFDVVDVGATVTVDGKAHSPYSVFVNPDTGKRAVAIANLDREKLIEVTVEVEGKHGEFLMATPEEPDARPCNTRVPVLPRSVVALLEQ